MADKNKKTRATIECEWCSCAEARIDAAVRVTFANLDGVVLDTVTLCGECARRGVTFNGTTLDSHD